MTDIWLLTTAFASSLALAQRGARGGPSISVTHNVRRDEVKKFNLALWRGYRLHHPTPAAELIIEREDFDFDYFTWGYGIFVSERMRQVMDLKRSTAHFFAVDDSQSAPLPRSMNYRMMEPRAVEALSDPENSEYEMLQPMPGMPSFPSSVYHMAFRADAAPKHELFYDKFFNTSLLCTDALAQRILEAGCTGVEFVDPGRPDRRRRIKTLKDVEEFD
jgi:hypothetical protein